MRPSAIASSPSRIVSTGVPAPVCGMHAGAGAGAAWYAFAAAPTRPCSEGVMVVTNDVIFPPSIVASVVNCTGAIPNIWKKSLEYLLRTRPN